MPNKDSERVRTLCAWAHQAFPAGAILDIGSAGANDPFLLQEILQILPPACLVVALDLAVEALGPLAKFGNVTFVQGSCYRLPFVDGAFQGAIIAEVLEHLLHVPAVLAELARVLRPGAPLLLSTPNPFAAYRSWHCWYGQDIPWDANNLARSLGNLPGDVRREGAAHMQYYDPLTLANLLTDAGFAIDELTTTNLALPHNPFSFWRQPLGWAGWRTVMSASARTRKRQGIYTLVRATRQ